MCESHILSISIRGSIEFRVVFRFIVDNLEPSFESRKIQFHNFFPINTIALPRTIILCVYIAGHICKFKENDARTENKKAYQHARLTNTTFVTDPLEVWTSASYQFRSPDYYVWKSGDLVSLSHTLWVNEVQPTTQYGFVVTARYRYVVVISVACQLA